VVHHGIRPHHRRERRRGVRLVPRDRSGPSRWVHCFVLAFTALSLGSCQIIGGSGPSGVESGGSGGGEVYQGFLEIDGGRVTAALELIRAGRSDVRGALQATSGLLADGEGKLRGRVLTLDLSYEGECPGRMSLEGEWDREERTYQGTVEASDCTGGGRGRFSFSGS